MFYVFMFLWFYVSCFYDFLIFQVFMWFSFHRSLKPQISTEQELRLAHYCILRLIGLSLVFLGFSIFFLLFPSFYGFDLDFVSG